MLGGGKYRAWRVRQRLRRAVNPVRPVLYRSRPFSRWGAEPRGTAICRIYIDAFVARHGADVTGRVLEVGDRWYTQRFGQNVTTSDVLDVDPANERATVVADLCAADDIPSDCYDCFLLIQTLQYLVDPWAALRHVRRVLRPGGVLLATVPTMQRVDDSYGGIDRWRFTPRGCQDLFGSVFSGVEVEGRGNLTAVIGQTLGLASEEFSRRRFEPYDPDYPLVVLVRAVK